MQTSGRLQEQPQSRQWEVGSTVANLCSTSNMCECHSMDNCQDLLTAVAVTLW